MATISAQTHWLTMLTFTHRITRIDLSGLRIDVPEHLPPPTQAGNPSALKTTVTELHADGAVLTIARRHHVLRFEFSRLALQNLAKNKQVRFEAAMASSNPAARIRAQGVLGPWRAADHAATQASGSFALDGWNLAEYTVLSGKVSANGSFSGTLGNLNTRGRARISQFAVSSSHHPEDLTAEFEATVNGMNGNIGARSVAAHFLQTTILASGSIASGAGQAKTVSLEAHSSKARIEDLLWVFVSSPRPAMNGAIGLEGHIVLPPGKEKFLRRIQIDGDFHISEALFTNTATEEKLTEFSERAQVTHAAGSKDVNADMESVVKLREGVAHLSHGIFYVPGATAKMAGTYDLMNEAIHLRGTLILQASLSKAAGGFKSILLLPLDPLYRKGDAGAVVPLRMTGTYSHPRFHVSLKP